MSSEHMRFSDESSTDLAPEPASFVADPSDDEDDSPIPRGPTLDADILDALESFAAKVDEADKPVPFKPADPAWLQTLTGRAFFAQQPELYPFNIFEIATCLSREPRFCGHTKRDVPAYSVAQHSVLVMHVLRDVHRVTDKRLLRAALIHDAAEAFWKDLPAPINRMPQMAGYRALIKQTEAAIFAHFGLADLEAHQAIKQADLQMLATEKRDVMGPGPNDAAWTWLPEPVVARVQPWAAELAAHTFMDSWDRCGGTT